MRSASSVTHTEPQLLVSTASALPQSQSHSHFPPAYLPPRTPSVRSPRWSIGATRDSQSIDAASARSPITDACTARWSNDGGRLTTLAMSGSIDHEDAVYYHENNDPKALVPGFPVLPKVKEHSPLRMPVLVGAGDRLGEENLAVLMYKRRDSCMAAIGSLEEGSACEPMVERNKEDVATAEREKEKVKHMGAVVHVRNFSRPLLW